MIPIIEVRDLRKQYDPPDGIVAVKGVSFEIRPGEIFSLLGPNGAGKTTTISMLSCLLTPSGGDAIIDGHSITGAARQVKQVIGLVPQEIATYNTISARENLVFWGKMYGLAGKSLHERVTTALEIAGISDRADDRVGTFSGGMKRRLNVAIGLLHEPRVLFLDEPTVGIDPQSRRRILDTVKELQERGMTIFYTTHYMEEAQELSDRIGIIDHGELIAMGTLDELTTQLGHLDTIRLDMDDASLEKEDLVSGLTELPAVNRAYRENGHIILQAQDANAVLPAILKQLSEAGGHVRQLKIQEPNLEAVFLHLTGRALRD